MAIDDITEGIGITGLLLIAIHHVNTVIDHHNHYELNNILTRTIIAVIITMSYGNST